jgi:hypothetical protein
MPSHRDDLLVHIAASSLALITIVTALSACRPTVDVAKDLQVSVVSSGWFDAGIENRKNKLLPTLSFTLKNVSDQKLVMLQVNAAFRRVTDKEDSELGRGFITAAGTSGLAPGATTPVLTVRSEYGYLGTEPRLEMLANAQFIDAKVELFGKYGSTAWKRLGEYSITRRLIVE